MPAKPRVIVVRAAGTNCDAETVYLWEQVGADAELLHIDALAAEPRRLHACQIVTFPGGFSFGDDIAAGRVFASQVQRTFLPELLSFVDDGGLVLGICNGFQVLVQLGMLPWRSDVHARRCAIGANVPSGYRDRWVNLRVQSERCLFLEPGRDYQLPMAHGEGRVTFASQADADRALKEGFAALTYAELPDELRAQGSDNPNGSTHAIAGLTDETGRIFGLMPHPDRFFEPTHHPARSQVSLNSSESAAPGVGDRPHGRAMFETAVRNLA